MARGAVGWNAPLRGQCRVDRVNAHTTWYFVRSVVCGVNQTQMCCSRESVSRGEGESCGFDRLSVSCLWGFDRFPHRYTVGIPTVPGTAVAMRVMGVE
jgi:hypothetical protein